MTNASKQSNTTPALEAQGLVLAWNADCEHPLLEDVSLTVQPGEICCLVGKSGSGKTTILHALAGLLKPCQGHVLLHGEDVTGQTGRVSYMLQKDLLLEHKRIIDNVTLPLVLQGTPKHEAKATADPLFERFGLEGTKDKWPHELSGGMRQRAAFLRTHLMGNDVVLLDEPFSALDALTRTDIRSWFRQMVSDLQMSALVITHDVDEAVSLAHRIYVLQNQQDASTPRLKEILVNRNTGEDSVFELSEAYLSTKKAVLDVL